MASSTAAGCEGRGALSPYHSTCVPALSDAVNEWILFCGGSGSHGIVTELFKKASAATLAAIASARSARSGKGLHINTAFEDSFCQPVPSAIVPSVNAASGEHSTIPSRLVCVIPITDNGGSSQDLIDCFGGPAVGDCRNLLLHTAGVLMGELRGLLQTTAAQPRAVISGCDEKEGKEESPRREAAFALLAYAEAVVAALKAREPHKEALLASFAVMSASTISTPTDSTAFVACACTGAACDTLLSLPCVACAEVTSRGRIASAIAAYRAWEEGLGLVPTEASAASPAASAPPPLVGDSGFLLPPPLTETPLLSSLREPVNYVGASTGNVMLLALFLEAVGCSDGDKERKGAAPAGALEAACRTLWEEVLCIPALMRACLAALLTGAVVDGTDVVEEPPKAPLPSLFFFPQLTVFPSIDYYRSFDIDNDDGSSPAKREAPQQGEEGASGARSEKEEMVRVFRAQQQPSLTVPVRIPLLQRHQRQKAKTKANTAHSLSEITANGADSPSRHPTPLSLRPLPFARLDTLLASGKVVEGQKEFSYGLGPTPHGTPLASRSASVCSSTNSYSHSHSGAMATAGATACKASGGGASLSSPFTTPARGAQRLPMETAGGGGGGVAQQQHGGVIPRSFASSIDDHAGRIAGGGPHPNGGGSPLLLPAVAKVAGPSDDRRWDVARTPHVHTPRPQASSAPPAHVAADDASSSRASSPQRCAVQPSSPPLSFGAHQHNNNGRQLTAAATITTPSRAGGATTNAVDTTPPPAASTRSSNAIVKGGAAALGADGEEALALPLCVDYSVQRHSADVNIEAAATVWSDGERLAGGVVVASGGHYLNSGDAVEEKNGDDEQVDEEGGKERTKTVLLSIEPSRALLALLNTRRCEAEAVCSNEYESNISSPLPIPHSHVIFSRGSFFTSLGAACAPVAAELRGLLRAAEGGEQRAAVATVDEDARTSGCPNRRRRTVVATLLLNGSVDRETRMFFAHSTKHSAVPACAVPAAPLCAKPCEAGGDASQQREGQVEGSTKNNSNNNNQCDEGCPVGRAVSAFVAAILHSTARESGNAINVSAPDSASALGYGQQPLRFNVFGVGGSVWSAECTARCGAGTTGEGQVGAHASVRWVQPKAPAFSSSLGARAKLPATLYNDEALARVLLLRR